MSFTRRLAAGLPAVGVTVLAALAFAGSPAQAATGEAAVQPSVTPTATCDRGKCPGYGYGGGQPAGDDDEVPNDNATGGATPGDVGPTRGQGDYSGGESPTPVPSSTPPTAPTTPTATTNTVPPGVSPTTVSPAPSPSPSETTPGGVSAGGTLPVTGPSAATIGVGALMVGAGGAAVWYTRRRRTA